MSWVFRPTFEVVKEGRILRFLSGYRRFVVDGRIIHEVAVSIAIESIQKFIGLFKKFMRRDNNSYFTEIGFCFT
jgi:hypothetical protein